MLPAGLDPDPAANGHGNALFYDWQFAGENEEYLDPARYQYREFLLLVDALYQGKPISYCPYIFVDNDAAIARGWTQGYPKRLGQVFQTRYYAATGKAGPALAAGSKFAGTLTAGGRDRREDARRRQGPWGCRLIGTRFPLRPHHREHQRDANSYGNFDESMKCDLPCRSGPRHQQHDRQRDAPEPISAEIRVRHDPNHSQDEHADSECECVRPEISRHRRAN